MSIIITNEAWVEVKHHLPATPAGRQITRTHVLLQLERSEVETLLGLAREGESVSETIVRFCRGEP